MNKNIVLIVLGVLVIGAGAVYVLQPQKEEQGMIQKSIEPAIETVSDTQNMPSVQMPASPEVPAVADVPPVVKAEKPAVPATHAVAIQNFAFSPAEMKIKKGDTIVWTNNDTAPHSVVADSFHSETLQKGQSFRFTFATAGTHDYICGIHPRMTGTVIVE